MNQISLKSKVMPGGSWGLCSCLIVFQRFGACSLVFQFLRKKQSWEEIVGGFAVFKPVLEEVFLVLDNLSALKKKSVWRGSCGLFSRFCGAGGQSGGWWLLLVLTMRKTLICKCCIWTRKRSGWPYADQGAEVCSADSPQVPPRFPKLCSSCPQVVLK